MIDINKKLSSIFLIERLFIYLYDQGIFKAIENLKIYFQF